MGAQESPLGFRLRVFKQVGQGFVSPSTSCLVLTTPGRLPVLIHFLVFCMWGLTHWKE